MNARRYLLYQGPRKEGLGAHTHPYVSQAMCVDVRSGKLGLTLLVEYALVVSRCGDSRTDAQIEESLG